jgi:hypothetical protein
MKEILINGEKWWYKITTYDEDDGGYGVFHYPETSFYKEPFITQKFKKYLFFGSFIEKKIENNKPDFKISLEITCPKNSKEKIKEAIDKELAIIKRKKEIENGEII